MSQSSPLITMTVGQLSASRRKMCNIRLWQAEASPKRVPFQVKSIEKVFCFKRAQYKLWNRELQWTVGLESYFSI